MKTDQVQILEANIKQAKEFIELDAALTRLSQNRDFKAVIQDGYLKNEAIRLVHLKADPHMQTPERQASVTAQIDAIGGLMGYFRTVSHNASIAEKAVEADSATIEELAVGGDE